MELPDFKANYYVVAFLDVLGQKDALEKIDHIPDEGPELEEFKKTFGEAYVRVLKFREQFEKTFDYMYQSYEKNDNPNPETKKIHQEVVKEKPIIRMFSDSIIFYMPLNIDTGAAAIGIYTLLSCISVGMLVSLATGTPVRGGIDVGVGAKFENGDLYGPVINSAYKLESEVAKWPRIMIGKQLIELLETAHESSDLETEIDRKRALLFCQKGKLLITNAKDDLPILDFLASDHLETIMQGKTPDVLTLAYSFVKESLEKFEAAGNEKLRERYENLLQFFKERFEALNYSTW